MNRVPIYQVDAFASALYTGNPAAVCLLPEWLNDELMQKIAAENNLSETAFVVPGDESYQIRWFTPKKEVDLCGHATLASAFVLFEIQGYPHHTLHFTSRSGLLHVQRNQNILCMDFPALPYSPRAADTALINAIGAEPEEVYQSTFDVLCIMKSASQVKDAQVDLNQISRLPYRGLILSAIMDDTTTVYSRCFYPAYDVPEDPVTGSAHCVIAPYWSKRLNKKRIHAKQGGLRQGELWCEVRQDRVFLSGDCQLYMKGEIFFKP